MYRSIPITSKMLLSYKENKGYTCLHCGKGDYDNCLLSSDGGELYMGDDGIVLATNDIYCTSCNAQWTDVMEFSYLVINHYDNGGNAVDSCVVEGERQGVCPYCGDDCSEGCEAYVEEDDGAVVRGMQCGSCSKNYQEVYTLDRVEALKIKTSPSGRFIVE